MTRNPTLIEVLKLHRRIIKQSGGAAGVRDLGALESSIAQPLMTSGGEDLFPSMTEKGGALGFSFILNHPFLDGNKRIGHGAMEVFLILNGLEINAIVDQQEQVILAVASGEMECEAFVQWVQDHVISK